MKYVLSYLLILAAIALILFALFLFWERINPRRLVFNTNTVQSNNTNKTSEHISPSEITIPKEHIHLPILPAILNQGVWETTTQGASYLKTSPIPGEDGNSII